MTLPIQKFVRKPFYIDAVQVTEENMEQVARWCGGKVVDFDETARIKTARHIKVDVHNPANERQKKAFVDDFVCFVGKGHKVYTERAFNRTFESTFQPKPTVPARRAVPTPGPARGSQVPEPVSTAEEVVAGEIKTIKDAKLQEVVLSEQPNAFGGTVEVVATEDGLHGKRVVTATDNVELPQPVETADVDEAEQILAEIEAEDQ